MALDDIPLAKRAGRGLQVLRELKSKPHRVFLAGPVLSDANTQDLDLFSTEVQESDDQQILEVMSKTGKLEQVNLVELGLSERTSNGSFISDTISDQEIYRAEVK